jgi:uncharacterized protein YjbI with pentapeptide repeats
MANQEQLNILRQGVEVWNKWRRDNQYVKVDLSGVDLENAHLNGVDLREADLSRSNLTFIQLAEANLYNADLQMADLNRSHLNGAYLGRSILRGSEINMASLNRAYLREADLSNARLIETDLSDANLGFANLRKSDLSRSLLNGTNFSQADLRSANLKDAVIGFTIFSDIYLSETLGLEEARFEYPSSIGTDTLQRSKGKIPEAFLRGCGLSDVLVETAKLFNPDLTNEEIVKIQYRIYDLRATQSIQISPLFISYSHTDSTFVDKLEKGLNEKGVRFWRDIHDMTAGRMETQIDRAIRQNPTVLLILSKNSMNSDWVQHEVRKARELEKELGRDALCPIALDDSWKSSRWPQRVMEHVMEYNILDFSKWEDESTFNAKFGKLLSGLDLFYKKPEK